jgi:hypothetical protein
MSNNHYSFAGYIAIIAAVLMVPMLVLGIATDVAVRGKPDIAVALLLPYVVAAVSQLFCSLFAFGRLKTFLNEKFEFHETDGLIIAIIIVSIVLATFGIGVRTVFTLGMWSQAPISGPELAIPVLIVLFLIGVPLSIMSIVFAIKLLRLPSDLSGFLKPYCYLGIAAAICFMTFILAPLGLILTAAGDVLLGMIFLRSTEASTAPDFV